MMKKATENENHNRFLKLTSTLILGYENLERGTTEVKKQEKTEKEEEKKS